MVGSIGFMLKNFAIGGMSGMIATSCVCSPIHLPFPQIQPIDMVKVRI